MEGKQIPELLAQVPNRANGVVGAAPEGTEIIAAEFIAPRHRLTNPVVQGMSGAEVQLSQSINGRVAITKATFLGSRPVRHHRSNFLIKNACENVTIASLRNRPSRLKLKFSEVKYG